MKNNSTLIYKNFKWLLLIMAIMTLLSLYVYKSYFSTKTEIFETIRKNLIAEKLSLFQNFAQHIKEDHLFHINANKLANSHEKLKHIEKELLLIKDKDIKYLYLLYRGKHGQFRYLIDTTTDPDERATVTQLFNPQSQIWQEAYRTKKYQLTYQTNLQNLWISVAYPIIQDNQVIMVLGADFTYSVYKNLFKILSPIENLFFYIAIFIILMFVLTYFLLYLYYNINKKTYIDPLTKIYNRQYLSEFLKKRSLQHYYLMLMDIDLFKKINDQYGHDVGDDVLVAIVNEAKINLREDDFIVRFGGEEFLIFVSKKDSNDVASIAQRIRTAIEAMVVNSHSNIIKTTISLGVNPFPFKARDIEEAIKIADEQLYLAKNMGRNRVAIFDDANKETGVTHNRISDIQYAIDKEKVYYAIQAIYTASTTKADKYEVLMRLKDKKGNIVFPDTFLPFIKNTQVYINLTKIILDKTVFILENNTFSLSINLDIQDILNGNIIALFEEIFTDKKLLAQRVTIEILEHTEITDFQEIQKNLKIFKSLGFLIAIDDFGSGYANFKYLVNLDIDIIKIDGTLIRGIDTNRAAYNVVKTILAYCKDSNIDAIVEQVETKEEFETLLELGVKYMQGYYLAKPKLEDKA